MKQKLLNLFTWRATLLVALLCTAFGNAWGQTTNTLTFTVGDNNSWPTYDGITWNGSTSWTGTSSHELTSSSITGSVKNVIVTAKAGHQNVKYKINVKVGDNDFGTKKDLSGTNSTNTSFEQNPAVNVNDKTIKITITITNQPNKGITIEKIQVTYVSGETIEISSGCYGKDENNDTRYFGTYSNKCQFVVPSGNPSGDPIVYTVNVIDNALKLNPLAGGTVVPANTGVLLSSSTPGNKTFTFKLATTNTTISDNLLVASSKDMSTVTGNNKFYHLSMVEGNIGFYYGAEGGVAWTFSGTNKAYLAVPQNPGNSIKGFAFGDGTNGIKAVETEKSESNAIYNLAGQRVSKMQKGLYIVNGKKMIQR